MIDEETRAALASQVIGGAFVRGRLDREQVADLKDGRLLLRPHSVFEIPPRIDWLAGRLGRPDEIALMALMLATDIASYVHGAAIPVDGGFLAA